MTVSGNAQVGIFCYSASSIEAAFSGTVADNGAYGIAVISGTLWSAGQPGATLDVTGNHDAGIRVDTGATFAGSGYVRVLGNQAAGVDVGGDFSCADCNIDGNAAGVVASSVPTGLSLTGGTISNNMTDGIDLGGIGPAVTALLQDETIAGNGVEGIRVLPATVASSNTLTLTGCDITGNLAGGMILQANELVAATGNKLHGNTGGAQLAVGGSGTLTFDGGGCAAASVNEIYCYEPLVGVSADPTASVVIGHAAWGSSPPVVNVDYVGNVDVQNECTPAVSCP
jgi:hypothetical protein